MSRHERALVCATAVVAMLVLWWAVGKPDGVAAWVARIAAVLAVPVVFFGVIAVQMMRQVWREEAHMTQEQIRARRRAAWTSGVPRATTPVLWRAWETWRSAGPDHDPEQKKS